MSGKLANLQKQLQLESLPSPKEFNDITPDNVADKLFTPYQPAVLRGFATDWPLVKASKQSPSAVANRLKADDNGTPVKLISLPKSTSGRMFYSNDLRGMNFDVIQTSLQQSIDQMLLQPDSNKYCVQCISVKNHFSTLSNEFNNRLVPNVSPFIWIGNDIRVAPHFDEANNIAVVVAGKRRFTLFPPDQIANLYVGPLDHTPAGQPISLVDLDHPDLNAHPKYPKAFEQALSVELNPGDAIFIPTPWWHAVQSLSPFNVLVNYWWNNKTLGSTIPFPMLMHALQSMRTMPPQEKQHWQAILSHYLLDNDDSAKQHIPDYARGILEPHSSQHMQMIHNWLKSQLQ